MPRHYVPKTTRGRWSKEAMAEAVKSVKEGKLSLRRSAELYNVPISSLQRRTSAPEGMEIGSTGRKTVLPPDVEAALTERLVHLSKRGFRLTPKMIRQYTYKFVVDHNFRHSFNEKKQMAGEDWFQLFVKRKPRISDRLSNDRASCGKMKTRAQQFYNDLKSLVEEFDLRDRPECIYNQDEIILPLNYKQKGKKEVESGEKATIIGCVNALGSYIPPFIVFKGVRKRLEFSNNLPSGSEVRLTKRGWINEEVFLEWIEHFNKYRTPGKVVLILDGQQCLSTLMCVEMCEKNDIELLFLPLYTSRALQPIEVSFLNPFKSNYNHFAARWLNCHRDKTISKLTFGGIFEQAWNESATLENAVKGFEATGIYPYNPEAFSSLAFILPEPVPLQLSTFSTDALVMPSTSTEYILPCPLEETNHNSDAADTREEPSVDSLSPIAEKKYLAEVLSRKRTGSKVDPWRKGVSKSRRGRETQEKACHSVCLDSRCSEVENCLQCHVCLEWYHECSEY
ncbi:uncharacterized protein LOC111633062 [Centruroides sculpturatus]|uniref:uncharacterized protein LOC111633062 n=1 Tax=Centruroides sculpturatus TaxID=218467 RepID=UPI000C6D7FB1|nr:uncharacterized protein LOC111633062 [Centruroides sculpturatus]